jgi:hypothetical protein
MSGLNYEREEKGLRNLLQAFHTLPSDRMLTCPVCPTETGTAQSTDENSATLSSCVGRVTNFFESWSREGFWSSLLLATAAAFIVTLHLAPSLLNCLVSNASHHLFVRAIITSSWSSYKNFPPSPGPFVLAILVKIEEG